jgi:adenylate kinase family enzyme
MRIAIFGNSGSGKSTLARRFSKQFSIPMLELDSLVWEPNQIAVPRPQADVQRDLSRFVDAHSDWIMEGCYGDLVERMLPVCTEIIFLNPGMEVCLANNRARPWEPHKYGSAEAQDAMLNNLLGWVQDYYTRGDSCSLTCHRAVFDGYDGEKRELTGWSDILTLQ